MSLIKRNVLLSALTAATLFAASTAAQAEMVLHRGNGAEPETMDPQKSTGVTEANIQYELFEGLTTYSPDGQVVAGRRGKLGHQRRRQDLYLPSARTRKWSNGDPVTAARFRLFLPAPGRSRPSPPTTRRSLTSIVNAGEDPQGRGKGPRQARRRRRRRQDPQGHAWRSRRPISSACCATTRFLPVHKATVEKFGQDWTKPGNMVGNGAFTMTEWTPQASLTVVKNPNYLRRRERQARQDRLLPDRGHLGGVQALSRRRARHHLRRAVRPGEVDRSEHEGRVSRRSRISAPTTTSST